MALEFVKINNSTLMRPLANFFLFMEESGDVEFFHPHPMTEEEAIKKCAYDGKDLYYVATNGGTVLAYGMLRGWDEGYAIPSLGIAVDRAMRGTGLGRAFMYFLHVAVRAKGAEKIRLKVYPNNLPAVNMYRSMGYVFQEKLEDEQMLGVVNLNEFPID